MVDLLGPGDAGAARALTTTTDVTSPLAGDSWFGDCVGGVSGTGTPIVSKWLNRALQQMRRVIRASGLSLAGGNADDDLLGQAIQCGGLTYAVAGGSVNAYTATLSPVPVTLPDGMEINVFFGTANTSTTPTLVTNGGSALSILRAGGGAVAAGDVSGPLSLISKAGAWRVNGLVASDVVANTPIPIKRSFSLFPTSNQSIPNNTVTAVNFGSIATGSDPLGFWSSGSPTIVTVPAGITTVRISCCIAFGVNNVGYRQLQLLQNAGGSPLGGRICLEIPNGANVTTLQVTGFAVACAPGDTFGARVLQNSGGALSLDDTSTSFTVEW